MLKKLNIFEDKQIANWECTKWLVISSCFFLIPSIYAYYNKLYYYSVLLLLNSLISANHWRNATFYSWRRKLDLVFTKILFVIFAINGVLYVRYIPYLITGYSGLIGFIYCFYLSEKLYEKTDSWYKYHFLFHFIVMYEQIIILDSMIIRA